jgi:hypothetical protein
LCFLSSCAKEQRQIAEPLNVASVVEKQSKDAVTIASLLREMTNRDSLAKFPQADFRLRQESSYDRHSVEPEPPKMEPTGWFANKDANTNDTHNNFIRIEENQGRKEWVLMDHQGAGALVRTWMPWRTMRKPKTDIIIRVYIDGQSEPVLQGNMLDLFNGKGLFPYPYAHESLASAVSFFPIPYARGMKITTSAHPFFYQFTYREYLAGTNVKSFNLEDFAGAADGIKETGSRLINPNHGDFDTPLSLQKTLASNQEVSLALPSGVAAIRQLAIKLGSYADPAVTRSVVLKIKFDGKETVWTPIGDFFGTGIGLHPFEDWFRTVSDKGQLTSRWVMPYQNSAQVSLVNLGQDPVDVSLDVVIGDWQWDRDSMYFNAAWKGEYPVETRPYSDWNYITLQGRGVYVGDTLSVMNPVERWWGEGDEKIFVDGETFPSIFGTGTEDYYAYSWGGQSTDFYQHPFHSQPRAHTYNKHNRKMDKNRSSQGYSTETRVRALDTMPFGSSLQLDMEVWSWTDTQMGYGVGVYWYGDANTQSNRKAEPVEVLNIPPLPAAMNQ